MSFKYVFVVLFVAISFNGLAQQKINSGDAELSNKQSLLIKVTPDFDICILEDLGANIGSQVGQILTVYCSSKRFIRSKTLPRCLIYTKRKNAST